MNVASPLSLTKGSNADRVGDKIFSGAALAAGIVILVVLFLVAAFLVWQAVPALVAKPSDITGKEGFLGYVFPLLLGTVVAAAIALIIATPIAIGVALFISHFAPRRLAGPLGYVVDLLAAVPSVVFGAWGLAFLAPHVRGLYQWLAEYLGWIPIFAGPASDTAKTLLTASIVLAVMIIPIIASISREVFIQTPVLYEEASLALGATRWEMIKQAVLPFARPGIVSGIMLGLGRALGETMAVALVLSPGKLIASLIQPGNQTIAAEIALQFPEAFGLRLSELIAAGLVLFIITLVVNMVARWIVNRNKDFSGAN